MPNTKSKAPTKAAINKSLQEVYDSITHAINTRSHKKGISLKALDQTIEALTQAVNEANANGTIDELPNFAELIEIDADKLPK